MNHTTIKTGLTSLQNKINKDILDFEKTYDIKILNKDIKKFIFWKDFEKEDDFIKYFQ